MGGSMRVRVTFPKDSKEMSNALIHAIKSTGADLVGEACTKEGSDIVFDLQEKKAMEYNQQEWTRLKYSCFGDYPKGDFQEQAKRDCLNCEVMHACCNQKNFQNIYNGSLA
jgi:hypothetical protein